MAGRRASAPVSTFQCMVKPSEVEAETQRVACHEKERNNEGGNQLPLPYYLATLHLSAVSLLSNAAAQSHPSQGQLNRSWLASHGCAHSWPSPAQIVGRRTLGRTACWDLRPLVGCRLR
jgi:hypothetical protein